jgi:flavin-dependent dehydrogenase
MCDVPAARAGWDGHAARRYDFDFTACAGGLRGYRWRFPCLVGGVPHVNAGVYALPPVSGERLQAELRATIGGAWDAATGWKAFPIRGWTGRPRVAAPRALLVGDAAAVDPLMGEGISFALEYGVLAAEAIVTAQATGDWSFRGYEHAVHRGPIGRKLRRLALGARLFYGRHQRLCFALAARSRRAQAIGLRWYNGVDGWDERGALAALGALLSRRPL